MSERMRANEASPCMPDLIRCFTQSVRSHTMPATCPRVRIGARLPCATAARARPPQYRRVILRPPQSRPACIRVCEQTCVRGHVAGACTRRHMDVRIANRCP
eukprot:6208382-Pleurochrysis_carterae.AAC.1